MKSESQKCNNCQSYDCDGDIYKCYGKYLEKNPQNTEYEVWDSNTKKWVKKDSLNNPPKIDKSSAKKN